MPGYTQHFAPANVITKAARLITALNDTYAAVVNACTPIYATRLGFGTALHGPIPYCYVCPVGPSRNKCYSEKQMKKKQPNDVLWREQPER